MSPPRCAKCAVFPLDGIIQLITVIPAKTITRYFAFIGNMKKIMVAFGKNMANAISTAKIAP